MQKLLSTTIMLALVLGSAACGNGGENGETGGDGTSDTSDTASLPEAGTNDTGTDTSQPEPDTGSDEDTSPPEEYVDIFRYEVHEQGCAGGDCKRFVEVRIGAATITKEDASTLNLATEARDKLQNEYLGEDVLQRMKNGWDCGPDDPDENRYNGLAHYFEAELGTAPNAPEPREVVSACIDPNSTKSDAELAQKLANILTDFGDHCFKGEDAENIEPCTWPN